MNIRRRNKGELVAKWVLGVVRVSSRNQRDWGRDSSLIVQTLGPDQEMG